MTAFLAKAESMCNCGCKKLEYPCQECEPICFSGSVSGSGTGSDESGPCVDFLTATTTGAPEEGLYKCVGGVDDQATVSWPGGSFFSPANQPEKGPCYGSHGFSFNAGFKVDEVAQCQAGSWGGGVGCELTCCLIPAP